MDKIYFVYLRFSSSKTFASWLVSMWTGDWPSHVEFVIDDNEYLGSDIDVGVQKVTDKYYENNTFKKIEYYKISVTKDQHEHIYQIANSQLGKGYDTWALIGNLFSRNWQKSNSWFCSELISYCFQIAGKPLVNKKTNRITPGDLLISPLLIHCNKKDLIFEK